MCTLDRRWQIARYFGVERLVRLNLARCQVEATFSCVRVLDRDSRSDKVSVLFLQSFCHGSQCTFQIFIGDWCSGMPRVCHGRLLVYVMASKRMPRSGTEPCQDMRMPAGEETVMTEEEQAPINKFIRTLGRTVGFAGTLSGVVKTGEVEDLFRAHLF